MITMFGPRIRVLAYPGGKRFSFTIVDDTDGLTLETMQPTYEYLYSLGLKTTKTVWVRNPSEPATRYCDQGDTLERAEYADYHRLLQARGFEVALHNVSSQSNRRTEVLAGLETFRRHFGCYPKINVHHEKNRENLYFDVAQDPSRLAPTFRSRPFQSVYRAMQSLRSMVFSRVTTASSSPHGCEGERENSQYFWGDICKQVIRYVRTNVFLNDLNALKLMPSMPVTFGDTPYVNYWFYSSNGQDVAHFNSILSAGAIDRLEAEYGCCILYTHFGMGFTVEREGRYELNSATKQRLTAIATKEDGWFAPAGEVLDRLLAFQKISTYAFPGGLALRNGHSSDIASVTLVTAPHACLQVLDGRTFRANEKGLVVLPMLRTGETVILTCEHLSDDNLRWHTNDTPAWVHDAGKVLSRCIEVFRSSTHRRHNAGNG